MGNTSLYKARNNKNDEFYTTMATVKKEISYFTKQFEDKVVYLNCDDPRKSNIFKYLLANFDKLKLTKLICSCYKSQDYDLFNDELEKAIWVEYSGGIVNENIPLEAQIKINYFKGDGDFRSEESINLLKQSDIIITNPPFSLFREYIEQLIKYDKKFLVLGTTNAITYKSFFPLIKSHKIWPSKTFNKFVDFQLPNYYTKWDRIDSGVKYGRVPSITWWTNMSYDKQYEDIELIEKYYGNEAKYPFYDKSGIINIDKVSDIPSDYRGIMGVPITFIGRYNPEQFEIVGLDRYSADKVSLTSGRFTINGKGKYARILIRNKRIRHVDKGAY